MEGSAVAALPCRRKRFGQRGRRRAAPRRARRPCQLADLRTRLRQPAVQRPGSNPCRERRPAGAEVDLSDGGSRHVSDQPDRRGRGTVSDYAIQPRGGAGRRYGPRTLALYARDGGGRAVLRRAQPRRGARLRPAVHDDRGRAAAGAGRRNRRGRVGHAGGRSDDRRCDRPGAADRPDRGRRRGTGAPGRTGCADALRRQHGARGVRRQGVRRRERDRLQRRIERGGNGRRLDPGPSGAAARAAGVSVRVRRGDRRAGVALVFHCGARLGRGVRRADVVRRRARPRSGIRAGQCRTLSRCVEDGRGLDLFVPVDRSGIGAGLLRNRQRVARLRRRQAAGRQLVHRVADRTRRAVGRPALVSPTRAA